MNNTLKFTGKATIYAKARPSYAPEFIDYLYSDVGMNNTSAIADIGSGTGILSRALLEKGSEVYCVEPNKDMRKTAENNLSHYPNFHCVSGTAENTTLDMGSIDFITVAQDFHWFDVDIFKAECQRILKHNGKVGFSGGLEHIDINLTKFFNNDFELKSFSNDLIFDKAKFIQRNLSASYSLKETDSEYKSYVSELEVLFDNYAVDDILTMPNKTVAYTGRL